MASRLEDYKNANNTTADGIVAFGNNDEVKVRSANPTIRERLNGGIDLNHQQLKTQLVETVKTELNEDLANEVEAIIGGINSKALTSVQLKAVFDGPLSAANVVNSQLAVPNISTDNLVKQIAAQDDYTFQINSLTELSKTGSDFEKGQANKVLRGLSTYSQSEMAKNPSLVRSTDDFRTPMEATVHLLSEAKQNNWNAVTNEVSNALKQHQINPENTRKLLEAVKNDAKNHPHAEDLSKLCDQLESSLPNVGTKIPPTRLQDNIYGRVMDTAIISSLVEKPPATVLAAANATGAGLGKHLETLSNKTLNHIGESNGMQVNIELKSFVNRAAEDVQSYLKGDKSEDVRFWIESVPELQAVGQAPTPDDARKQLIQFLKSENKTGEEAIATSWIAQKMSISLKPMGTEIEKPQQSFAGKDADQIKAMSAERASWQFQLAPWMKSAGNDYQTITAQRDTDVKKPLDSVATDDSGVTLGYQRQVQENQYNSASTKPGNLNTPNYERAADGEITGYTRAAMETALEQGHFYVSGASGTTNILMHMSKHLNNETNAKIDMKDGLLNAAMFVVHDGGHSLQEVLVTANIIDERNNMGFGQGTAVQGGLYSANYKALIDTYQGSSTGDALNQAFDSSLDKLSDYFQENSAYASDELEIKTEEEAPEVENKFKEGSVGAGASLLQNAPGGGNSVGVK